MIIKGHLIEALMISFKSQLHMSDFTTHGIYEFINSQTFGSHLSVVTRHAIAIQEQSYKAKENRYKDAFVGR